MEVFLETHRSRSGKIQKNDEAIFDTIIKIHLKQNKDKDLVFVPVTINYDRVIEGEIFPLDLLGEQPMKVNALTIIKQLTFIKK